MTLQTAKTYRLEDSDKLDALYSQTVGTDGSGADYQVNGVNDNVEIQSALTANSAGGEVFIKKGVYNYQTTGTGVSVNVYDNQLISGEGRSTQLYDSTLIDPSLADNKGILKFDGESGITISDIYFRGNQDDVPQTGDRSGCGIRISGGSSNVNIHDCYFIDGVQAVKASNCENININNIHARNHDHPIFFRGDGLNLSNFSFDIEAVGIRTGYIQRGIYLYHARNANISNGDIKNCSTTGMYIRTEDTIAQDSYNINIDNVNVDNTSILAPNAARGSYIETASLYSIYNVNITNCNFATTVGRAFMLQTDVVGKIHTIKFVNCTFSSVDDIAWRINSTAGAHNDTFRNIQFVNCEFTSTDESAFYGYGIQDLLLDNCKFNSSSTTSTHGALILEVCDRVVVNNCILDGGGTAQDIYIHSTVTNYNVTNCKFVNNLITIESDSLGIINDIQSFTLADDASFTLPDGTAGYGFTQLGDNDEYANFTWSADGTVTLLTDISANVVNTDTDTKFCIFDNGSGVTIRNRIGSSKTLRFNINYS